MLQHVQSILKISIVIVIIVIAMLVYRFNNPAERLFFNTSKDTISSVITNYKTYSSS